MKKLFTQNERVQRAYKNLKGFHFPFGWVRHHHKDFNPSKKTLEENPRLFWMEEQEHWIEILGSHVLTNRDELPARDEEGYPVLEPGEMVTQVIPSQTFGETDILYLDYLLGHLQETKPDLWWLLAYYKVKVAPSRWLDELSIALRDKDLRSKTYDPWDWENEEYPYKKSSYRERKNQQEIRLYSENPFYEEGNDLKYKYICTTSTSRYYQEGRSFDDKRRIVDDDPSPFSTTRWTFQSCSRRTIKIDQNNYKLGYVHPAIYFQDPSEMSFDTHLWVILNDSRKQIGWKSAFKLWNVLRSVQQVIEEQRLEFLIDEENKCPHEVHCPYTTLANILKEIMESLEHKVEHRTSKEMLFYLYCQCRDLLKILRKQYREEKRLDKLNQLKKDIKEYPELKDCVYQGLNNICQSVKSSIRRKKIKKNNKYCGRSIAHSLPSKKLQLI